MFNKVKHKLKEIYRLLLKIDTIEKHDVLIDELKVQNGKILTTLHHGRYSDYLNDIQKAEFKVFSQWDDDGIIQFLVNYLDMEHQSFIEFGVENYKESNTRFLLINNNWKGLVIDGTQSNIDYIKNDSIYWKYDLKAVCRFVTAENINQLITDAGFQGATGLLHIDIDGNDYWIWNAIEVIHPIIVIVEYNSVFGDTHTWTIPYKSDFYRTNSNASNLYYGASLSALCDLAAEKGYLFVGSNSHGNNAYFIRNDKIKNILSKTPAEGYVMSKFRESRDTNGKLTYLTGKERLELIRGLEVYNTKLKKTEKI